MRHGKKFNHLSRQTGHRKAMLANMACSLIEHKRINTTVAKAKALKQFVEPLITKSKEDTTHNRRIVFAYLRSKYAVTDLFRDVAAKVGDRPGGYTRIIKVGNRLGDNADMAMIELVDFNELYNGGKKEVKKAKSRRGGKAKNGCGLLKLQLLKLKLLSLLNNVFRHSIKIKDKLLLVYPFFFERQCQLSSI
jgi:large subunit ribosomal protein L17